MDRVRRMTDDEIDYSDIPPLTEEFWKNAKLILPPKKIAISMRVDEDILSWYKHQKTSRYQTLMMSVLRTYMEAAKHRGAR
jgi:uncharacterized protein (DUF4415 family)